MKLQADVYALKEDVTQHRRWLHQHPETGFQLEKTKSYILSHLREWNFDSIEILADSGIKAVMKAHNSQRVLAFRADMDALFIEEANDLSFASSHPGRMHACGHDGHMAILLGFAKWLSLNKKNIKNDVVLIFQPAEETVGGALPMIEEGALNNPDVDVIFGIHLFPDIPQGKFGIRSGPLMAQACEFNIEMIGKSAHGAMPHRGIDTLLAACGFITDVQSIITRKVNPLEHALITVGKMIAGESRNILAEKVAIEGIIRTFNEDVFALIKGQILDMLRGLEISYGIKALFEEISYYPVVNNDNEWTQKIVQILEKDMWVEPTMLMISEDFSFYQQKVPGVFSLLGTRNPEMGYINPLHSNQFNFDEGVLLNGIQFYVNILKEL